VNLQSAGNVRIGSTILPKLFKDFPNFSQLDHVILQVPLKEKTLWLECTNPDYPLGYVHSNIAGHEAVLIKETGGEVLRLPAYKDSLNTESHTATISLTEEGSAMAKVIRTSNLIQYEQISEITKLPPVKQIDYLREDIQLPQARVNNVTYKEDKSAKPSIVVNYNVNCEKYGNKTGNRLFVPINIFRRGPSKLANKKRIHPIYINYGYLDSDTITLEIPKNYTVESLPKLPVIEEKLMDAATVLGACGTAYALRYIRASMQAGIEIGFDAQTALAIAAQTAKGAAKMLLEEKVHPEQLIDKVTTPQGCTIVGLNEMEHQGFSSSLIKGIKTSLQKIKE
jgi:hypothetical protein